MAQSSSPVKYRSIEFLVPNELLDRFYYVINKIENADAENHTELWYAYRKVLSAEFNQYRVVDKPNQKWYNKIFNMNSGALNKWVKWRFG